MEVSDAMRNYIYKVNPSNHIGEAKVLGVHRVQSLLSMPVDTLGDLLQESVYILTKWDRTVYCRAISSHSLEVIESLGAPFEPDSYLIILPKH